MTLCLDVGMEDAAKTMPSRGFHMRMRKSTSTLEMLLEVNRISI